MVVQGNKKDKVKVKDTLPRSMKMKSLNNNNITFGVLSTQLDKTIPFDDKGYELIMYLTNKTDDMKNDVHIKLWEGNKPDYIYQALYYDNSEPINTSITGIINELFYNSVNDYNFSYYDIRRIFIVGVDENIFNTFSFGTLAYNLSQNFVQKGRPNSVVNPTYRQDGFYSFDFKTKLLSISKDNNNVNNPQVNGWEQIGQNEFYLYVKKISLGGLTPGSKLYDLSVRGRR
jgi:hypothetical protein